MADQSTIARPYAKAVFELAQEQNKLEQWGKLLQSMSSAVDDPAVMALLYDPRVSGAQVGQILVDALGDRLDAQGRNFVRLLAHNGRVGVLPDISAGFDKLHAEAERTVDVSVTSAAPLSEQHKIELAASLQQRLGRDVRLHCEINESLIGGAVVRAGDLVIDSSLRGRLQQLASNLNT
ncbi:MAG: F0F1 ATP synthase subunit delta [Gammaproteobacteria bacterium]|nr:F0F1 ATP synthase subunit delta [Gammaproteobacteria bacterium]MDH3766820.1 F0F1 ATP synthase subunit delta [Gammaproteobacteria bacterium]